MAEDTGGQNLPEAWSASLVKVPFKQLAGWTDDDHASVLSAFLRICNNAPALLSASPISLNPDRIRSLCDTANTVPRRNRNAARRFFETEFSAFSVPQNGFLTGYYEPELFAARNADDLFRVPLLSPPSGLVTISEKNRPEDWPADLSHGRYTTNGIVPLPDRGAIMTGALSDEKLELVYLSDPIDAFFVHVQGSARLRLTDGTVMRVGYAGKTGHPYTSIGKVLVSRGEGTADQFTMNGLRHWLATNTDQRDTLLAQNRSYIFFREIKMISDADGPIGAASLPLVAGRSMAVDRTHIPLGLPVFLQADDGETGKIQGLELPRLLIADDTGSAIKGPARADVFIGSGKEAGDTAGMIRHSVRLAILIPNGARIEGVRQ